MSTETSAEWRDGFVFVGNELCLDFLNTSLVMSAGAEATEMLPDAASLARWMKAAGLVNAVDATRLTRRTTAPPMHLFWQFREHLRDAVFSIEAGGAPASSFVSRLNAMLWEYPYRDEITADFKRIKRFRPQSILDVFAPVADSVASLLTVPDQSRLRKCDSCVIHFHDTSKKGVRRWCSMNLCGNRAKVAAYAKRKREEA